MKHNIPWYFRTFASVSYTHLVTCLALWGTNGIPSSLNLFTVPLCGGLPISSLLVAALSITNIFSNPRVFTLWVNTLSLRVDLQILPWQIKSTFIIVLVLLVLPRNALFCKSFRGYCDMLWNYRLWQIRARLSKLLLPVSSKIGSKREWVTTKDFHRFDFSFFPKST